MGIEVKDPAASTDHLTSNGKKRHRKINPVEQMRKYEAAIDIHANDLVPVSPIKPMSPAEKRKTKYWWQKDD